MALKAKKGGTSKPGCNSSLTKLFPQLEVSRFLAPAFDNGDTGTGSIAEPAPVIHVEGVDLAAELFRRMVVKDSSECFTEWCHQS